jgi:hypothetical protein
VAIDDGLPPGESTADTLREAALRAWRKFGGWACSATGCTYVWPLTEDLLRLIARAPDERDHDGFAGAPTGSGGESD